MTPLEEDGRRGYQISGELALGRLLRGDTLRALEARWAEESNSRTVVALTVGNRRWTFGIEDFVPLTD